MPKNFQRNALYLGLFVTTFGLSACETVDQTTFEAYDCKDLRAYSQWMEHPSNESYGPYVPPSEDKLLIDQNRDEPIETLLNSDRNSVFKRKSALRKAYKDKGC